MKNLSNNIIKNICNGTIIFLSLFILGIVLLIGSCAKKDDSTDATTAAAGNVSGITASGTISGIDNLTGTFNMSWVGEEPSGGCINDSSALTELSDAIPSGTLGFKKQIIITSSTSFTQSMQYYSEASCATMTGHMNFLYKDFAVGDNISGLTAGSNPTKPTTANKVSYKEQSLAINCNTDACTTFFNSTFGASALATLGYKQGTELVVSNSDSEVNIWETFIPINYTKTYLLTGSAAESTYPTDWSSSTGVFWQQ